MPSTLREKENHEMLTKLLEMMGYQQWEDATARTAGSDNVWHSLVSAKEVLGIKVNPIDRTVASIKQRQFVKNGAMLPYGYHFGQWGTNGIAVESIPDRFKKSPFGNTTVESGGAVLCHTIPQMIAEYMDQLDAGIGLQQGAAFKLPNAQGTKIVEFEGLHALTAEIGYTLSQISEDTTKAYILGLTNQAENRETLRGLGLPIETKQMDVEFGNSKKQVPYVGVADGSPSISKLIGWVLRNVAILVGGKVKE